MTSKIVVFGVMIFTLVMMMTFWLANTILDLNEVTAVIVAIGFGLVAEIFYRRKMKEK